jgi:two-component system, probable response regulator PhcQ
MKPIVLLIDDDVIALDDLERALCKLPYQVFNACSGDEAMEILKSHDIDVIVVDEVMPGVSGGDLLAWAAENVPDTMRIMLTGNISAPTAIRAINEGRVYNFFTKPCDNAQLAVAIRKAVEHRSLLIENRRLLEVNRRQFQNILRFSKKIGLLARVVAKDLRVPLEKVTHSCFALTDQYADFFEPKAKLMLENAVEAVSEVQHIVNELLTCARSSVLTDLTDSPHSALSEEIPVAPE